ncbi:hypothetical protein D9M70_519350 [compost metagenome]
MSATLESGTVVPEAVVIFRLRMAAISVRKSRLICTRIGISRPSSAILVNAASISPMVATRITSEICAVVMPRRDICSSRGRICSSGRGSAPSGLTLASNGSLRSLPSSVATAWSRSASLLESRLKERSRSPRSLSLMTRTSGMSRTRAKISFSICDCGMMRPAGAIFGR